MFNFKLSFFHTLGITGLKHNVVWMKEYTEVVK